MPSKFQQGDQRGGNDNMLTPPYIVEALGPFDLNPCFGLPRPWDTADRMYALEDGEDGLQLPWAGRVWLNQPYSEVSVWAEKMADHNNGIMLVFARTDTKWFHRYVIPKASAILFIEGRLGFYTNEGVRATTKSGKVSVAGAPSILVAYDNKFPKQNSDRLYKAVTWGMIRGEVVWL